MTARLAVAGFLFALALSLDVYFAGVERSLNRELERVGPGRAVLTHFAFGQQLLDLNGTIGSRLDALKNSGELVYLRRVPQQAKTELLGEPVILTYRDRELLGLQHFFPGIEANDAFLLTDQPAIPESTSLQVAVEGFEFKAKVLRVPENLLTHFGAGTTALVPSSWTPALEQSGFVEIVLYESHARDFQSIARQMGELRQWLELDRFSGVNLRTGFAILERLEALRAQQALWSTVVRSIAASLVVLVFASCAFLEYRENAYLSALLQSMGVPRAFLFIRYTVEHGMLLLVGFALAASVIDLSLSHLPHLEILATDYPGELFAWSSALFDWWPVLLATTLFSLIPVGLGLRKEIGKILQ